MCLVELQAGITPHAGTQGLLGNLADDAINHLHLIQNSGLLVVGFPRQLVEGENRRGETEHSRLDVIQLTIIQHLPDAGYAENHTGFVS